MRTWWQENYCKAVCFDCLVKFWVKSSTKYKSLSPMNKYKMFNDRTFVVEKLLKQPFFIKVCMPLFLITIVSVPLFPGECSPFIHSNVCVCNGHGCLPSSTPEWWRSSARKSAKAIRHCTDTSSVPQQPGWRGLHSSLLPTRRVHRWTAGHRSSQGVWWVNSRSWCH